MIGLIEESTKQVNRIDPDIAVHKSISLAAKIVYQRQRNVANELRMWEIGSFWERRNNLLRTWFNKCLGLTKEG